MSKPSLASKISDAFKRLFGRSTRPVVSSKPEDMAAADAPATRAEGDVTETTPAETADADAAAEFATEAVSSGEQRPTTQPPEPGKPLETSKAPEAAGAPEQAPETARGGGDSAAETGAEPESGGDEPLSPEERAEIAETLDVAEAKTVAAPTSAFTEAVEETRAAEQPAEKAPEESAEAPEEAPLPNYDSLTLPSVRARLRKLTIDQVRQLRAYEAAHANRPEFVRMFDNRVAKLEAQSTE